MKEKLGRISEFLKSNQLDEARQLIAELLQEDASNEELYFFLGQIYYKKQEWGSAINAFNKVLEINPKHTDAQSQIDMTNSILGYFTPDMFNP